METTRPKNLLFSVTIKDFEVQTFRSGGSGGQNQNKVESGVRLIHHPSGARAESRETRDQLKNKRLAFSRIARDSKFKAWHKRECARLLGMKSIEEIVDEAMAESNLKIEVRDENGKWQTINSSPKS